MIRTKREINISLLDSVTADMLGGDDMDFFQDDSLRVERILLELVRPDPLQPRRILPDRIYQAFHGNRMTPTQALRELIQTAQLAARQQDDLSITFWICLVILMIRARKIYRLYLQKSNLFMI